MNVPFFKPSFNEEEEKAVIDVIQSGWLTTGKVTHQFEEEFAKTLGSPFALAVNSNTNGMILAMEACGVKKGTCVITTPYTFVSTATSAVHLGAKVLFADIQHDSFNIDPDSIEKILKSHEGKKVKAIVPVHIAGNVCDMEKICYLAKKFNVKVIEDCAHSFPSLTKNGYAGTLGDCGVFSFYATKTMTTGEGGMVTCKDPEIAKRITAMRLHGMNRDAWDRYTSSKASWEYDIIGPGYKSNLPDVLSAIGIVQLKKAFEFYRQRKETAALYNKEFSSLSFVILPPDGEGNAWHLYLLGLDLLKLNCDRNTFAKELQDMGVGISMHFIPIYNFSYWKKLSSKYNPKNFPNAQNHYLRTISIPLFPGQTKEQAEYVIECVKKIGFKYLKQEQ